MRNINPNLSGLKLPQPLVDAVQLAFREINSLSAQAASGSGGVILDTHVNRNTLHASGTLSTGTLYVETDRGVTYIDKIVNQARTWTYYSGTMAGTFAQIPTDLGPNDTGFLYRVTTGTGGVAYNHLIRWTGTGWEPADAFGGFFQDFTAAPIEPGWHPCDGTATHKLSIAAGVVSEVAFTTPDMTSSGGVYRKGGAAYTGTITAVGTITLSGNTGDTSGGTPTGTVSQPTLTMNSYTPTGTVSQPTFSGNLITFSTVNVLVSSTQPVLTSPTTITPSGTVSQPTFTGNAAVLTGTVSQPTFTGNALPVHHHDLSGATASFTGDAVRNIAVQVYFRR